MLHSLSDPASGGTPGTTVPSGGPAVATIPTPTGTSVTTSDDGCGCCIPVGPDCAIPARAPPTEDQPEVLFDECALQLVVIGKCSPNKGKVYRETVNDCGHFDVDATGDPLDTLVPVYDVCGKVFARKTDGTLYERDPSDGTWSVSDCGPVAEANAIKCVVVDIDAQGDGTFSTHVVPTPACYREDVTDDFCTQGG